MDKISENLLNEFCAEHDLENLKQESQFEHFSAHIVTHRHYSGTFATGDIVTGAGNDIGLDAIAILVNGTLVPDAETLDAILEMNGHLDVSFIFVQAERSSSFDGAKILVIGDGVAEFFSDDIRLAQNKSIKEFTTIADKLYKYSSRFTSNPSCFIYYVTTGIWMDDSTLLGRIHSVKDKLNKLQLFSRVDFTPVDSSEIFRLYQQSRNAISRTFIFKDKVPLPEMDGVTEAHIGILAAEDFLKLICDETGQVISSLFYDNVRDFLGDASVNEEIERTICSDAKARFVLMNNGVTIIAGSIKNTSHKYTISDYSIVNGCQTSHVLARSRLKLDASVIVPIRLIGTKDEVIKNGIIKATNRQTAITSEQFFALEEFPKQLEEFFKTFPLDDRLYFERRDEQYARTSLAKTRIVTRANAIKAYVAMFREEPHRSNKDYTGLKAEMGKSIFAKGHKFEPYYTASWMLYRLEGYFRNFKIESALKPARFHILYIARCLANNGKVPPPNSHDMRKYCDIILKILWDNKRSEELILRAARIVKLAARNQDRNHIRTQEFTNQVVSILKNSVHAEQDWREEDPRVTEFL